MQNYVWRSRSTLSGKKDSYFFKLIKSQSHWIKKKWKGYQIGYWWKGRDLFLWGKKSGWHQSSLGNILGSVTVDFPQQMGGFFEGLEVKWLL